MFEEFNQTIQVKRFTGGQYVNGRWVEGFPSIIEIQASKQPLSGGESDLKVVPEGRRVGKAYKVYTETELRPSTGENPDRLLIDDAEFEVYSYGHWNNGIIPHNCYVAVKVSEIE